MYLKLRSARAFHLSVHLNTSREPSHIGPLTAAEVPADALAAAPVIAPVVAQPTNCAPPAARWKTDGGSTARERRTFILGPWFPGGGGLGVAGA
ncbi:hypothetical protein [Streptomyces sp. NPDC093111]|uniref:hypothetical protein n=1 Tax=Streptomyces sp. NPDC093111 TaxID=3154978 RepID=UPI003438DEC2